MAVGEWISQWADDEKSGVADWEVGGTEAGSNKDRRGRREDNAAKAAKEPPQTSTLEVVMRKTPVGKLLTLNFKSLNDMET